MPMFEEREGNVEALMDVIVDQKPPAARPKFTEELRSLGVDGFNLLAGNVAGSLESLNDMSCGPSFDVSKACQIHSALRSIPEQHNEDGDFRAIEPMPAWGGRPRWCRRVGFWLLGRAGSYCRRTPRIRSVVCNKLIDLGCVLMGAKIGSLWSHR
jgi:hypothetical protein